MLGTCRWLSCKIERLICTQLLLHLLLLLAGEEEGEGEAEGEGELRLAPLMPLLDEAEEEHEAEDDEHLVEMGC